VLRLQGGRVARLWEELLPGRLRGLAAAVAQIDALVREEALRAPLGARWEGEAQAPGPLGEGARPADDREADVRAFAGARAPLRPG